MFLKCRRHSDIQTFYFTFVDAFARVVFSTQAAETRIIFETRNPTWNQMLIFYDLTIWGDVDAVIENPPTIMNEIFDYDPGVSDTSCC